MDIDPTKLKHRELLLLLYERVDGMDRKADERAAAQEKKDASQDTAIDGISSRVRSLENYRLFVGAASATVGAVVGLIYKAWPAISSVMVAH